MADEFESFGFDDDDDYNEYDNADNEALGGDDIDQLPDDTDEVEEESRNNSPFYKAAGLLLFIFILSLLCGGASYAIRGRGADPAADGEQASALSAERFQIETRNAEVAVTNAAVTQTIIAMETEAATTPTPDIPPTDEPTIEPTDTPVPTSTPLFQPAADGTDVASESGDSGDSGTVSNSGSSSSGGVYTPTPIPGLSGGGGTGTGTLPETGISVWGAILIALALIGVFIGARKIRFS